ncbi:helix-turn-helix transcriptional regulator [Streptococcus oricebi]|uniref:Helix-turn-helix transcriptional regulator n=1 Tax=Streptococcus oricebi TaxID=1547447 RepID=A0ABS5B4T8_9STRE|nr:LuxR C-terminal-related transcriptional regulator [Streptococcus oricebi]MBP2623857.1 helix-turn-helix transcriptional regulator [Streptococcus oricebi]
MFTEALYLYNTSLIVLYSVSLALALATSLKEGKRQKKTLYLVLALYFAFFILDNSIISMTELISHFATNYNQLFQGTSFIKTCIFLVNNFCQLWLLNFISKQKIASWERFSLFAIFIFMLLPLLPTSPLKVYLYYLPNQILLFYIGLKALLNSQKTALSPLRRDYLKIIGKLALIFSLLILVEDSIIIFHLDQYKAFNSKIINRNLSEDLFSISVCILSLNYFFRHSPLLVTKKKEGQPPSKAFFKDYQLTAREEEVCQLLLEQKRNQEIAQDLYLSVGTVKTHVHNIYIKMNIRKRDQLFSLYQDFMDQEA